MQAASQAGRRCKWHNPVLNICFVAVLNHGVLSFVTMPANCTQGYILGQYALLWAAENPDLIDKMIILNTPLSLDTPLPPYISPYKNPVPFLRPKVSPRPPSQ